MINDGPGATAGIHDFGVFYVQRMNERFVVRGADVYKIPQRDVLKLRPSKANVTKLTESDDVRISIWQRYSTQIEYTWESSSVAGDFELKTPVARLGETWKLYRHTYETYNTVLFGNTAKTASEIESTDGVLFDINEDLQAVRIEHTLTSLFDGTDTNGLSCQNPTWQVEVNAGGLKGLDDPVFKKEVLAHLRARTKSTW